MASQVQQTNAWRQVSERRDGLREPQAGSRPGRQGLGWKIPHAFGKRKCKINIFILHFFSWHHLSLIKKKTKNKITCKLRSLNSRCQLRTDGRVPEAGVGTTVLQQEGRALPGRHHAGSQLPQRLAVLTGERQPLNRREDVVLWHGEPHSLPSLSPPRHEAHGSHPAPLGRAVSSQHNPLTYHPTP